MFRWSTIAAVWRIGEQRVAAALPAAAEDAAASLRLDLSPVAIHGAFSTFAFPMMSPRILP